MKYKIKSELSNFTEFCKAKENRSVMICLMAVFVLLMAVQLINVQSLKKQYVYDEKGNLVAIIRGKADTDVSVPVKIGVSSDGQVVYRDVILNFKNSEEESSVEEEPENKGNIDSKVDNIVSMVSEDTGEVVYLPSVDEENNAKILWKEHRDFNFLLIPLIIPMAMICMYRGKKDKIEKEKRAEEQSIECAIPRFCNQLLLMLSSGIVLEDALKRIAASCEDRTDTNGLYNMLWEVAVERQNSPMSMVRILEDKAKESKIRDLLRLVKVLDLSQNKGTAMVTQLELESEILWNKRKNTAKERGRAAEVKLSIPLAMLLVSLIMITGAPAMLQM